MARPRERPWSTEEVAELEQLHAKHGPDWVVVGSALGRTPSSVRCKWDRMGRSALRESGALPETIRDLHYRLLADIRAQAIYPSDRYAREETRPPRGFMAEVFAPDAHFGKYAWAHETGDLDWDTAIAQSTFGAAVNALVERARVFQPEKWLFPFGNDVVQTDSSAGTTTAGTHVDSDGRHVKTFRVARQALSWAMRRMAEIAPVQGVCIPGNHDAMTAFYLGEVLAAEFAGHPRVTIDATVTPRKYVRFGTTLLGFAHGHAEKLRDLPQLMAFEAAADWAETTHREWHTGHRHTMQTLQAVGTEKPGVRVRTCPALCPPDAWHAQSGYVGSLRAAECYIWHRDDGYVGHFSSAVKARGVHPVTEM